MSAVLPREERDAIRAVLGRGWVRCDVCIGVSPSWDGHEPGCSEWARERLTALLDALDAAEEEHQREHREAVTWRDLARAEQDQRRAMQAERDTARQRVVDVSVWLRQWDADQMTFSEFMANLRALAADEGETRTAADEHSRLSQVIDTDGQGVAVRARERAAFAALLEAEDDEGEGTKR